MLLATHLVDDVAALAHEVLVLDEGRVRFAGSLTELTGIHDRDRVTGGDVELAYLRLVGPKR